MQNLVAELQQEINELIQRLNILNHRISACCKHQFLNKMLLRVEWHRDKNETVHRLQTIIADLFNLLELPPINIERKIYVANNRFSSSSGSLMCATASSLSGGSMASVPENNTIQDHDSFAIDRLNFELNHMTVQLIKDGFIRQSSKGMLLVQTMPVHINKFERTSH
jgi:hypothetical protein